MDFTMKNRLIVFLAMAAQMVVASAQEITYRILHETDTVMKCQLSGITLGTRDVRYYRYEYPSKDSDGKAVTISGVIVAPSDIVNGDTPCDGVILFNHPTIGNPSDAPSQGGLEAPSAMLASPLKPNYVMVMSDYIGYGSSIDHPICYLAGETNARNSLDGLLAARQLMADEEIPQGKYLFNVGYSQGGTESMYVAKLRDMEYKDKGITFDKTFVGGGMLDCEKAYAEYVQKDQCDAINDVAMFLISVNENFHLGIKYSDLFQEPLASNVAEVIRTKDKSVLSRIGVSSLDSLHQLLTPAYMNLQSPEAKALSAKLAEIKISNGWEPDPTQRYYMEHSRHDNYVPIQCARAMITWLRTKGYTPSLVPGKTNLQTNMMVFKLKHQQSGIVWAIQTMAAIQFWPVAYYEGGLNRYYYGVVRDLNLMKAIKLLESLGINLKKVSSNAPQFQTELAAAVSDGSIDANGSVSQLSRRAGFLEIIDQITSVLAKVDLTLADAYEMLDDSGITIADITDVVNYFSSSSSAPSLTPTEERTEAPVYLLRLYEETLAGWYLLGGYDVEYSSWGW